MDEVRKQAYGFTCGPAALLSVLHEIDGSIPLDHDTELDIWRDANLAESFATSAHGLALAALRRGFKAKVIADRPGIGFERRLKEHFPQIRDRVLHAMYDHTVSRSRLMGLVEEFRPMGMKGLQKLIDSDIEPIVLISTSLMDEDVPIPHWVIVLSMDKEKVMIANPETGQMEYYPTEKFSSSFGYDGYKALLIIWR